MAERRRRASIAIDADGITVECDGPLEALDTIQRDAFEVRLPEPTDEEALEAGRILVDWLREVRRKKLAEAAPSSPTPTAPGEVM